MYEDRKMELIEGSNFEASSVDRALQRVRNTLNYSLKEKYGIEDPEVTEKFLKMHGLDKAHFDFINNFENLIEAGSANASIDINANRSEVSVTGMFAETALPINKIVGYRYLYRKMKEMYGKKRAKQLSGDMYDMSLALADSTNILKLYCFSVSGINLVQNGKQWGSAPSLPPKRINSYISALCETLHQLSNHTAGALAVGSFFFDLAHMMLFREHNTLTRLKTDQEYRKYVENALQSFVHSMNHLSRNAMESPFTNISMFDRVKIQAMIADDNMGWYFDWYDTTEDIQKDCGSEENWKIYVQDVILEIQELYMGVMDRGDVMHNGRPFTFPVSTVNFSRIEKKDGSFDIEDKKFLHDFCKNHDIVRFNIYCSEGNKVASCCFSGDQSFVYFDEAGEEHVTTFKAFANEYLKGSEKETHIDNSHRYVIDPSTSKRAPITGVIELRNDAGRLVELYFEDGTFLEATPNQKFYDLSSNSMITALDLLHCPDKYNLGKAVKGVSIINSTAPVYDIEVATEDHTFYLNDVRVSNCRLVNDIDLFSMGGQVNSFGGTGLSLGSHRVLTIDLNRVYLESYNFEDYKRRLKKRMDDAADILIAHREVIKDQIARGTQPFCQNGWLDLNKTFSTFGLLGYYEAVENMKKSWGEGPEYLKEILILINDYALELTKVRKNPFNIEQIPAEGMSSKVADCDRWIYGEDKVPERLYSNQFLPNYGPTANATIAEKMEAEAMGRYLTGGGICHLNVGEKLTTKQAEYLIGTALKKGLEHFAVNCVYSICPEDHWTLGDTSICPACFEGIIDHATRVVGFFTRVNNWSKPKREVDFCGRHWKSIEELEK